MKLLQRITDMLGTPQAVVISVAACGIWALVGIILGFSDSWMLVINTFTTIVTFIMTFVILNSAKIGEKALQKKDDEIIKALPAASNDLIAVENRPEELK